jgi:hypothetical protein
MLWTLIPLIPIGLVVYVIAYVFDRDDARARADEFIAGIRKPIPKDIDKCMLKLEVANRRLLDRNETDRRRVDRLRDMRKEMVTPHD